MLRIAPEEMPMAKQFKYYDDWRSTELECPSCHWKGTFEQGEVGYYRELMDSSCPKCSRSRILAVVLYPTIGEMKASGSPSEIQQAERAEEFQRFFDSHKLISAEQLPKIESPRFELTWDSSEHDGKNWTVIKHADQVLFEEPEVWEGCDGRFEQVCHILSKKYGDRITDLVPSIASEFFLYGDYLSGEKTIEAIRAKYFRRSTSK
jgi:hypothetical protein